MAPQAHREIDERFNDLCDKDQFWGPLIAFRPEKNRNISSARVLVMATSLGTVYGMLLNLILALICRSTQHAMPSVFIVPLVLTFTYFVAFQFTLGPAWNRRARLIVRREGYLQGLGRTPREL